eukprot:gene8788-14818_t
MHASKNPKVEFIIYDSPTLPKCIDIKTRRSIVSVLSKIGNGLKSVFKRKGTDTKVDLNPIALLDPPGGGKSIRDLTEDVFPDGTKPRFDATGTFFWCERRPFQAVVMNRGEAEQNQFRNHVLVLILNSRYSPPIGLRGLVLPLRASNFHANELKKIVILGDGDYLMREGSPYSRADLRAVNVNLADMVIIFSPSLAKEEEHQALSDKESILVTQNLKAMCFEKVDITESGDKGTNNGEAVQNNPVAIPSHIAEVQATGSTRGANIPIITELVCDSNAMYLDQDDMNIYDDDGIYLTQPYACGSAFTMSVLDSLVSATYFNSDILTLVRNLVTGAVSPELDTQMAEGVQITGTQETPEIAAARNRCRVGQISLYDGPLSEFGECGLFGDLFLYALRTYNMICLGLYRFRDNSRHTTGIPSTKRYVITFPEFNFVLAPTDLALEPGLKQSDETNNQIQMRVCIFLPNEVQIFLKFIPSVRGTRSDDVKARSDHNLRKTSLHFKFSIAAANATENTSDDLFKLDVTTTSNVEHLYGSLLINDKGLVAEISIIDKLQN